MLPILVAALAVNPTIDIAWQNAVVNPRDIENYRRFIGELRVKAHKARAERKYNVAAEFRAHRRKLEDRVRAAYHHANGGLRKSALRAQHAHFRRILPSLVSLTTKIAADNRADLAPTTTARTTVTATTAARTTVAGDNAKLARMSRAQLLVEYRRSDAYRRGRIAWFLRTRHRYTVPGPVIAPTPATMPTPAPLFQSSTPAFAPSEGAPATEGAPAFTPSEAAPEAQTFTPSDAPEATPEAKGPNWLLIGGVAAVAGAFLLMRKKGKSSDRAAA